MREGKLTEPGSSKAKLEKLNDFKVLNDTLIKEAKKRMYEEDSKAEDSKEQPTELDLAIFESLKAVTDRKINELKAGIYEEEEY